LWKKTHSLAPHLTRKRNRNAVADCDCGDSRSAAKGNLLPGPDAAGAYNDFAFALPGGGSGTYFDLKTPLIAARLRDLVPLWEMA
jgi:hypothetical protein